MIFIIFKATNDNFKIKKFYGDNKNDQFVSMVLLEYQSYELAVHVFHERGSFLWIGNTRERLNSSVKWFNDIPRGMQKYDLTHSH